MDDAFEVTEVQQAGETAILPALQPGLEKFVQDGEKQSAFQASQKILHDLLVQKARQSYEMADQLEQLPDEYRRERRTFYLKLLSVMDSIDRTIKAADPQNHLVEDVETIRNEFFIVLEEEEILPLDLQVGQPFDPATCEAAARSLRPDVPQNTIIQIERRGYNWQGKTLRKARVTISKQS